MAGCFNLCSFGGALKNLKNLKNLVLLERGFTLVELGVAMAVVGILSTIAVPTFLHARNNSYDKEAQATVDAALWAAQQHYSQYGDFSDSMTATCVNSGALAADIQRLDPTIDVVLPATTSTGPRVVSIQANTTWNSNGESLGCQAFYATVLSRSGTCWIGRTTVEGKYLLAGSTSPIIIKSDKNTSASSITEFSGLDVNGNGYASFKRKHSGAGAITDAATSLANAKLACSGLMQGTGSITPATNVVLSNEYYASWRLLIGAAAGATS